VVRAAYTTFAKLLRFRLLETTGGIFELAYALSPKGRDEIHREQMEELGIAPPPQPQAVDALPPPQPDAHPEEDEVAVAVISRRAGETVHRVLKEVHFQRPVFESFSDDEEGDLLETVLINDPDDRDSDDDLAEDSGYRVPGALGDADPMWEEEDDLDPANEPVETDGPPREEYPNGFDDGPSLYAQAEAGLTEILNQFSREHAPEYASYHITSDDAEQAMAAF
jgi:hypothetical protein